MDGSRNWKKEIQYPKELYRMFGRKGHSFLCYKESIRALVHAWQHMLQQKIKVVLCRREFVRHKVWFQAAVVVLIKLLCVVFMVFFLVLESSVFCVDKLQRRVFFYQYQDDDESLSMWRVCQRIMLNLVSWKATVNPFP